MSVITSIYLPSIQKNTNAEFIAHIFERNDIAQVSRVAIEFNKKNKKYAAYIAIDSWNDTENAYNFIARLKNPNKEARIVYKDDDWWVAEINYLPHKLYTSNKKRVITIFSNKKEEDNFCDFDRTRQLKTALFGQPVEPDFAPSFDDLDLHETQDALDFEQYLREIDIERDFALGRQDILYELNFM
jgi:hypothetical protein